MLIAANWKMNLNLKESIDLIDKIIDFDNENKILIFPSNLNLNAVASSTINSKISIGCQNFYSEDEGAFTGEITLSQLPENVEYVLIGHSERRNIFKEDNKLIKQKVKFAIKNNYKIILCVGESLETKENGKTIEFLFQQLDSALDGVDLTNIIVAYEPIWAIGSGETPTGEEVSKIAKSLTEKYPVPVLYGGSVNEENISEFTEQAYIEGVLVGGASLDAENFKNLASF